MEETKTVTSVEEKRNWEEALEQESWVAPLVDIYETNDEYYLVGNMPGVEKEDVKLKIEEGNLIVPEKPAPVKHKPATKINITALIRENTDLQVSNSAKYFIAEWVETALNNLVSNAHQNAILRGDSRLTAAHFFWLETNNQPNGHWPSNEKYMRD